MRRPGGRLLAAAFFGLLPWTAHADLRETVNWARMQGCSAPVARARLGDSAALAAAAQAMRKGDSLEAALGAVGYRARTSASLHVWGASSDAEIASILARSHCATLVDPQYAEVGGERRGSEVWLILAAPLAVPSVRDADRLNEQVLRLVNAARAAGRRCGNQYFAPAGPLTFSATLNDAALGHSREMAKYGEFKHDGHDGSTPTQRIERAGFGPYGLIGENIAAGAMTPEEVMRGWLESPEHCENIMESRFSQIGIGFAVNVKTSWAVYWTQDFAAPGSR